MDCKEYETLITDYLENKCTSSDCRQMESHLSECKKYRDLAELEGSIIGQLSSMPPVISPDEEIDQGEFILEHGATLRKANNNLSADRIIVLIGMVNLTKFTVRETSEDLSEKILPVNENKFLWV